ncbi:MAG: ABC transporter ATP-binding protein [Neofamilia sp.]
MDLVYQESIFNLIDKWKAEKNRSVISVVHDLRLARMYGNKALLLKDGKVFSFGVIEDVMTRENLKEVYNFDVYEWMNRLNENWRE